MSADYDYLFEMEKVPIHLRMLAIINELPAIGKVQKNQQQGFLFRGHDDVMNVLNPLLSKWGVFVVPRVIERLTEKRTTSKGSVMYEVNLHVEYTFYGADGDWLIASAWGEGTDSGDKSTNKAMTMAFKNVIAQSFAINTAEAASYDADKHSPEETYAQRDTGGVGNKTFETGPAKPARRQMVVAAQRTQFAEKMKLLADIAPEDGDGKPIDWTEWTKSWVLKNVRDTTFDTLDRPQYDAMLKMIDGVIAKVEERVHGTFGRVVDEGAIAEAVTEAGEDPPADVDIPFDGSRPKEAADA